MAATLRSPARALVPAICLIGVVCLCQAEIHGAPPLHQQIDAIVDGVRIGPQGELCSDGEFVRRIHLDLLGIIPTATEAKAFIDDETADKRARLIDQLLADVRFAHHMQIVFDAMLMERRPEKHIQNAPWRAYLLNSFRQDKPLNDLAREILWSDPDGDGPRAAARFYLDREVQPHLITRDVGRLMLGRDLQCAQCHDHPVIDDYEQSEYFGIYAFVNRSYLFTDKKKKQALLAEKAEGDVSYESVFDKGSKHHTGPRLPGRPEIGEPALSDEERYQVKPPKGGRGVPAFSRRKELAQRVTSGAYGPFNRNMANRLWAVMFGRGIVHPLDLHHNDNPPAHPELLRLLGEELAAMKFDTRTFLRELALSSTYQRSCRLPDNLAAAKAAAEKALAEQQAELGRHQEAVAAAKAEARKLAEQIEATEKALAAAPAEIEKATKALEAADKQLAEAATALQQAQQFDAKTAAHKNTADALAKAQQAAAEKPDDQQLAADAANLEKTAQEAEAALKTAQAQLAEKQAAQQQANQNQAAAKEALETANTAKALVEKQAGKIDELQKQQQQARGRAQSALDKVATAAAIIADAETLIALAAAGGDVSQAEQKLLKRYSDRFFVYGLRPLSGEQLAISMHQAVGDLPAKVEAARQAEIAKAAKEAAKAKDQKKPAENEEQQPQNVPSDEQLEIRAHEAVYKQLQGEMDELVGVFAQTDGQPTQDYEGRAVEALYLANSPRVKGLVGGRLAQQLTAISTPSELADVLYLSILSRRPTPQETGAVADFLNGRDKDRKMAIEEMIWGLVSSTEFRFNH